MRERGREEEKKVGGVARGEDGRQRIKKNGDDKLERD